MNEEDLLTWDDEEVDMIIEAARIAEEFSDYESDSESDDSDSDTYLL